jgi:hypothetical protein
MAKAVPSPAPQPATLSLDSAYARAQYGRPYPRSALTHFGALVRRQRRPVRGDELGRGGHDHDRAAAATAAAAAAAAAG